MPRFWIFMYRISPLTYQISSMFSVAVAGTEIQCADSELLRVPAYSGMDCRAYLQSYIDMAGGRLINPHSLDTCLLCPLRETDEFLATLGIHYKNRWWQFAIQLGYIACNMVGMAGLYWITRVWGRSKNFQGRKK
jgi:ATP-binding cassette subfamily G (WHITE) protein 2 (PDR)